MSAGPQAESMPSVGPRPPQGQECEQDLYVKAWLNKVNNWATLWELDNPGVIIHSVLLEESDESEPTGPKDLKSWEKQRGREKRKQKTNALVNQHNFYCIVLTFRKLLWSQIFVVSFICLFLFFHEHVFVFYNAKDNTSLLNVKT